MFLSVHLTEGFGHFMAKVLQLGVDVIATDFGGNTDFCTGSLVLLVRWQTAPIPRGGFPGADGYILAEPDINHVAEFFK